MRAWAGMDRRETATGNAADYAQNTRFYTEGEVRRRRGLVKFAAQGGTAITSMWNPAAGRFALFATSTGTLESQA